jgi:flagellar motility protein MotE (MotC chaperone)
MKPLPRLLPLVAVAIGGVIAIKALSDFSALPQVFAAAVARAEESPSPAKSGGALSPAIAAAVAAPAAVRACAQTPEELAKSAGVSPGDMKIVEDLGARRGQLDERERMLDTQIQLLAAAETKVDSKLKALNGVKAQIQALLGQADQQQQTEIDRLVTVYEKMKPADAAAVFATLDDKVRIPVAAKMKPAALAQILAKMPTLEAKKVTESLAHRYSAAQTLSEAADAPPQPDSKESPPAKLAAASSPESGAPDATPADAGDAAKPPIKIHMTVKKPPHRHRLLAHARRDTPTLAAAKAAMTPNPKPRAAPPEQTAASAKVAPAPMPTPHAVPSAPTPPAASVPKVG